MSLVLNSIEESTQIDKTSLRGMKVDQYDTIFLGDQPSYRYNQCLSLFFYVGVSGDEKSQRRIVKKTGRPL
jgi:hypothetical protein